MSFFVAHRPKIRVEIVECWLRDSPSALRGTVRRPRVLIGMSLLHDSVFQVGPLASMNSLFFRSARRRIRCPSTLGFAVIRFFRECVSVLIVQA